MVVCTRCGNRSAVTWINDAGVSFDLCPICNDKLVRFVKELKNV